MHRSSFILGSIGAFIPHYLMGKGQSPREWWNEASDEQKASIRGSYDRNKAYDKGFTLAAFNAIESSGGLHLLRIGENSGGMYAQRAYLVAQRIHKGETPTAWQVSRALQKLVTNREFDDEQARAHIDELLGRYGDRWMKVWSNWNSKKEGQAEDVRRWIRFFQYNLRWK